jgi:hypothetical protein
MGQGDYPRCRFSDRMPIDTLSGLIESRRYRGFGAAEWPQ